MLVVCIRRKCNARLAGFYGPGKEPAGLFCSCLTICLSCACFLSFLVSHREGKFRFELSKLMIVAKTPRDEL